MKGMASKLLGLASALAVAAASTAPAAGQDTCQGRYVRRLAGPHAVTRPGMKNVAELQKRLPELEPAIRAAVAKDPTLSPAVADAVIAAIRSGSGIGERKLGRAESFHWMAYQPSKGDFEVIAPPCVSLKQDYDAFEITVEVPDAAAVAPADATCAIQATRRCEPQNPTVSVSVAGSNRNPRVTVASAGQINSVTLTGSAATIVDPAPYDADLVFTVRAEGSQPAARMARSHRFVIPKVCGNLAYIGEAGRRQIAEGAAAATCEKSVTAPKCQRPSAAGAVAPVGGPAGAAEAAGEAGGGSEAAAGAADLCSASGWTARGFLFGFAPQGDKQERALTIPVAISASEKFEIENGLGAGASVEHRLNPRWGIEGAALVGRAKSKYTLTTDGVSGSASHNANFYALTAGPNLHLLGCAPDLYLGAFVGFGGFADPNYWVNGHHFAASFDGRFLYGAQLGLDAPFGSSSNWGLHAGLRYFMLDQDTDAGTLHVDPLLVELGLAYRF